jgi:hypothetical protein
MSTHKPGSSLPLCDSKQVQFDELEEKWNKKQEERDHELRASDESGGRQ